MSLDGWRTIALTVDYPHHAGGSGYGRLARAIDYDAVIVPPTGPIAKLYDTFVRKTSGNQVVKKFTRRRIGTEVRYLIRHGLGKRKLIHAFYGEHHSWLLRTIPKGRQERRVMTIHLPPSLWHVSFKANQLQQFDAIVLMSHSQIEPLRKELGYGGRVEVIEHGVDVHRFAFIERTPDPQRIECIMVGNFLRDYDALAAFAKYCEKNAPEIAFHVVANMEAAAPVHGLPNVTHHQGISDERLVQLYQAATFAFFTLADCTANNAILEAMATGLPTFANDIGGVRTYVVENQENIRDLSDHAATVAALRNLAADVEKYQAQTRLARANAERFSWENIARRTLALYREVIGTTS